jgi:predicted DNA-binding transcriptional regulator YafY
MWGNLYREAALSALAKLENLLPEQQREEVQWARRTLVTAGLRHPSLDAQAATFEALRRAIRSSHRVEMIYTSASNTRPASRKLDPYAIAFRWGWWYVVGYCHTRREVRTFRIDRIQELGLSGETFQPPKDFNARDYMDVVFQGQLQVPARLKFAREAASIAHLNRPGWDSLKENTDGSVEVTFSAPDLDWAASSVLAYGPLVEVLDPPELRQKLRNWAEVIVKLYSLEGD